MTHDPKAQDASAAFEDHNHAACVSNTMQAAKDHCEQNGLKLTPARARVLEILVSEHRAMGAYDILPILAAENLGSQPPIVYRALDFLMSHGFVHKVEHLNAYVACAHPGEDHTPAFLICTSCDRVAETHSTAQNSPLSDAAQTAGFKVETTVIEARGICPKCEEA
ncbi:MAG: transcriptional repressor [Planktomarina sp.]